MRQTPSFPDPSACKTQHISMDYWQCLSRDAGDCRYALRHGNECLCRHPENYDFSEEFKYEAKS